MPLNAMPLNAIMQSILKKPGVYSAVLIELPLANAHCPDRKLRIIASAQSDNVPSERDTPPPDLVSTSLQFTQLHAEFSGIKDNEHVNLAIGPFRIVLIKINGDTPLWLVVAVQSGAIISKSLPRLLRKIERKILDERAQLKLPAIGGSV